MHLYIITRGIKHLVDDFINQLSGKYMPFKWRYPKDRILTEQEKAAIDEKGMANMALRVSVRPIQLWEIVYPENFNDQMLSTLLAYLDKDGKLIAGKGDTQHKKHSKFIWGLRKMLGLEEVPDYKLVPALPITRDAVEINAIGIKKDYYVNEKGEHIWNPTEEQKKEMWEGI